MNITIYYEYQDGVKTPLWVTINLNKQWNWTKDTIYFSVAANYLLLDVNELPDDQLLLTVTLGELVVSPHRNGCLGIFLPRLRQRAIQENINYNMAKQLLIRLYDIEEILSLTRNHLPHSF